MRMPLDAEQAQAIAQSLVNRFASASRDPTPASASDDDTAVEETETGPFDYLRAAAWVHWYERLLRVHQAAARALAERDLETVPAIREEDQMMRALAAVHRLLLEHPVAAKAAYAAVVAEGRAFALTVDGAALRARLRRSPVVQRAALLWRSLTMGMLVEDEAAPLPSAYLDSLVALAERRDLEQLLGLAALQRGRGR